MKCPKCSYISFDYNEVCPKCNKDISTEQRKMNHPTYKPSPPFLLGSLTGGGDQVEETVLDEGQNLDMGLEMRVIEEAKKQEQPFVPPALEKTDLVVDSETEDLEPISNFELDEEVKEVSLGNPEDSLTLSSTVDEEEAISLNLDEPPVAGTKSEETDLTESALEKDGALGIDIDDLSLDEIPPPAPGAGKGASLDESEMVTLVIDKKGSQDSHGLEDTELELDLEDLEDN